jgi:hypothetical protein
MANSRYYSSIALPTTLTGGVTNSGTSIAVASTSGFPGSLPYILALDYGTATEELVLVTNVASLTLTVTRAYDGTAGSSHNTGAVVRHVSSAIDFTDSRTHEASSTGVHGVAGTVVGTSDSQTLSNKNLILATGSLKNISMFNQGASGITQIIGDSTNPNANRLEIKDNEVALNTMVFVQSTGNIKSVKNASDTDATYKIRLTDSDGTTDRAALLGGGTLSLTPTSATTFVTLDLVAPDTSTTKRAIRVAAAGGGTERFTVFNDGRLAIVGQAAAQTALKVTAAASPSVDIFNVSDSGSNTLFAVQSTGKFLGNKGGTIAQPGVTTGAVMQVGGSNVGYTGNLEQWVGPANSIVANINEVGNLSVNNITTAVVYNQFTEDVTSRTTTSTTYAAASAALSRTIIVPPSGKVWVSIRTTQRNSTTNNTITSWSGSGSTSGTVYSANDNAALIASGAVFGANNISLSLDYLLNGLTSGETLTVTMLHRVNAASTGTFDYRSIGLRSATS